MGSTQVSRVKRLGRYALGVGFVAGVTTLGWFNVAAATIAICAVILVVLYPKADALIEVSFGPLRAKLQRDLTEAEKLVEKLRTYAALQAKTVIAASCRTGRFFDPKDDWQLANLRSVEERLRDLGVSESELVEVRSDLLRMTIRDLGNAALGGNITPMKLGNEAMAEWSALRKEGRNGSPDEVEGFLKKWGLLTPERQSRIDDMRWIIEHQDVRDREQFLRAHQEVPWDS